MSKRVSYCIILISLFGGCTLDDVRIVCSEGTHLYNETCEADEIENCGEHNYDCATRVLGWSEGECKEGKCILEKCKVGFHLFNNACEEDTPDNCGEHLKKCQSGLVCSLGECKTNCDADLVKCTKLGQPVCIRPLEDTTFCGADSNCENYSTCSNGESCQHGICTRTSCANNLTLCPGAICVDLESDVKNCGQCYRDCTGMTQFKAKSNTCSAGKCQFECESGYENCGTAEVPNCISSDNLNSDPNNCGQCGNNCLVDNAISGICVDGHCEIKCENNFHIYDGKCEEDSVSNCGSHGYDCSKEVEGWSEGECAESKCVASECSSNFHIYEDSCEKDSISNCGSHGYACDKERESCTNKVCKCPYGFANATYNNKTVSATCISTLQDFMDFRDAINSGNAGSNGNTENYYILLHDIDLGVQNDWYGVGTSNPFRDVFIGNNKTISGTLNCSSENCGIFAHLYGYPGSAIIKDLKSTVDVTSTKDYVGGVVGKSEFSSFYNVTSTGKISGKSYVGGISGYNVPGNFYDCSSSSVITASDNVGGIVGYMEGGNLSSSSSSSTITVTSGPAGGILGATNTGVSMSSCHSSGKIIGGAGYYGGLVGMARQGGISSSYSTSNIECKAKNGDIKIGGVLGHAESLVIMTSYYNGQIRSNGLTHVGGLVGELNSNNTISKSGAFGSLYSDMGAVGGLVGTIENNTTQNIITNSFSVVDLTSACRTGVVGYSPVGYEEKSEIACNWVGSVFKGSGEVSGAVIYGNDTFKKSGPVFVYNPTYTSASNKSYADSCTLSNNRLYSGSTPIISAFSGAGCGGWKELSCTIKNGLNGPGTYTLPIPDGLNPDFCK